VAVRPFIGREAELAALEAALGEAQAGQPQVVVVSGPSGIGKSWLLAAFAEGLTNSGVLVLKTACAQVGDAVVPLVPVTTAVRQLMVVMGAALTAAVPAALPLVDNLPENRVAGKAALAAGSVAELFAAVVHRLGADRPVVWLVDDMQWADRSTSALIDFLVRTQTSAQVLLVLATRDVAPGTNNADPLSELSQLPHVTQLPLPAFTGREIYQIIDAMQPGTATWERIDTIFDRSAGNPLFTTELIKQGDGRLSSSLQHVLLGPTAALKPDATAVVQLVAVSEFCSHPLLAAATGLGESELLAAIREAMRARIITAAGDGYTIRHALLREAIVEDLLPVERVRLHRTCAQGLEGLTSTTRAGLSARAAAARHWAQADEPQRALPALISAAKAAGESQAYAVQAQLLADAIDCVERAADTAGSTGMSRSQMFTDAAAAATWSAQHQLVINIVDKALREDLAPLETTTTAMLLAHRAMALHHLSREGSLETAGEALAMLRTDPSAAATAVRDYLANVLLLAGRPEEAHDLALRCARTAADLPDPGLRVQTQTTLGWVLGELGHYRRSIAALEAAQKNADGAGLECRSRIWLNLAAAHTGMGSYTAALDAANAGLTLRPTGIDRSYGAALLLTKVPPLIALGRLREAETTIGEALSLGPGMTTASQLLAMRAEIALLRGDRETARCALVAARLATAAKRPSSSELSLVALESEFALTEGAPQRAAAAAQRGLQVASGPISQRWRLIVAAARSAAHPGVDDDLAQCLRDGITRALAGMPSRPGPERAYSHMLAAVTGNPAAWNSALAEWEVCGNLINTARCATAAAEAAVPADHHAALPLLQRAETIAQHVGADGMRAEVRAIAAAAHLHLTGQPRRPGRPLGLTSREMQVLALIAEGATNAQIAATLFISPKTVSTHVSNILAKLGVASRAAAAAHAHRSGLVSS
jgi:DNA-binding CsgD family transcriptional regulator/tetratricopeptide (TPR) repeat protein